MYVLCTLVLLSLNSLFKRPKVLEPIEHKAVEDSKQPSPDAVKPGRRKRCKHSWSGISRAPETSKVHGQHGFKSCLDGINRKPSRRCAQQENVHARRRKAQVRLVMLAVVGGTFNRLLDVADESWRWLMFSFWGWRDVWPFILHVYGWNPSIWFK